MPLEAVRPIQPQTDSNPKTANSRPQVDVVRAAGDKADVDSAEAERRLGTRKTVPEVVLRNSFQSRTTRTSSSQVSLEQVAVV
jgi:hypothetical protein